MSEPDLPNESEPEMSPAPSPGAKRVLVIDDDKQTCAFFKTLLASEGFQVMMAYSGQNALTALKSENMRKFDLILLDLMMPGYGGYEVLKELQQTDHSDIPIFIITARTLDSGAVEMLRSESNVSDFWSKPVDIAKFKVRIHEVLGTKPPIKGSDDVWQEVK